MSNGLRYDASPAVVAWAAREGLPRLSEDALVRAHRCCCHGGEPVDETVDEPLWPAFSELEQRQRELAQATLVAERDAAERERTA